MNRLPIKTQQRRSGRKTGAGLDHFNGHALKQKCKSRVLIGPRHEHRQDAAFFAFGAWDRRMNRSGELHRVQMSPRALRSQIGLRTIALAFGALAFGALEPSSAKNDMDINGFLLRQKLNAGYFPIGVKTRRMRK